MFARYLGPNQCGRCLLPLIEGDQSFHLQAADGSEVSFCYECGIKEMAESYGQDPIQLDEYWHERFKKPGDVNELYEPSNLESDQQ